MRIADIDGNPVVEKIKLAFAGTEYPGDGAVPGRPDSVNEAKKEFRRLGGRRWEDLEVEEIPTLSPVLMWLSPEGFGYYLPAFLASAVIAPSSVGSLDCVGFLAPPSSKDRSEEGVTTRVWFRRLVDRFTPEQKTAVRECLEHLRINLDGVFSYWSSK